MFKLWLFLSNVRKGIFIFGTRGLLINAVPWSPKT